MSDRHEPMSDVELLALCERIRLARKMREIWERESLSNDYLYLFRGVVRALPGLAWNLFILAVWGVILWQVFS